MMEHKRGTYHWRFRHNCSCRVWNLPAKL